MRFYLLYRNHGLYDPVLDDTEEYYVPIESQDLTDTLLEEIEKEKAAATADIKPNDVTPKIEPLTGPVTEEQTKLNANLYDAILKISTGELPPTARFKLPISEEYDPEGKRVSKLQKLYNKNIITVDLKTAFDEMRQQESKVIDKFEQTEVKTGENDEMTKKELQYSLKAKDLDLESLKREASQIVEESINKAVSLAKDIKQEINVELKSSSEGITDSKVQEELKQITQIVNKLKSDKEEKHETVKEKIDKERISVAEEVKKFETLKLSSESYVQSQESNIVNEKEEIERLSVAEEVKKFETLGLSSDSYVNSQDNKTVNENEKKERLNVAEEIKKFETLEPSFDSTSNLEERKLITKQDIEETIQEGTVRRRSEMLSQDNRKSESFMKKSDFSSEIINKTDIKDERKKSASDIESTKKYKATKEVKDVKEGTKKAERKAYSLGLQTVPHIRAYCTSSNSNLLLKTFFLQLTKIMVALSKYLMLEETITAPTQQEKMIKVEKELDINQEKYDNIYRKEEETTNEFVNAENEENYNEETLKEDVIIEDNLRSSVEDARIEGELIRKAKLSGAKIAQIEGRKPADLTDKMDIVISELQRKSGIEEHTDKEEFFRRSGRSRSKSKSVQEENIKRERVEDDLQQDHFFDQRDKHFDRRKIFETHETKTTSMDIKEMISEKRTTEYKSTKTEKHVPRFETESKMDTNFKKHEVKSEINENINLGDNLTYVAIVEAHVYTNKDAIFAEKMRRLSQSKKLIEEQKIEKQEIESTKEMETVVTDTQALSLADSVIIEPVKVSLTVQPIEDTLIKYARSSTEMEQVSKQIAVQNIVQAIEPLLRFETHTVSGKQAQAIMEMPMTKIAETTNVSTEDQKMFFKAEVVLTQRSFVSIEEPEPVVEITEITTETDESVPVEELQPIEKEIQPTIELPVKSVAEIAEVIIDEANIEVFQVPQPINKTPNTVLEKNILTVAETMIASAEYGTEEIVTSNLVTEQAKVNIGTNFAVEISETSVIEKQQDTFDVQKVLGKQSETSIVSSALSVAESSSIICSEPKDEPFKTTKTIDQQATSKIKEFNAAEVSVVYSEEPKREEFIVPQQIIEQSNISIDEHKSIVSTIVIPEEPKEENLQLPEITQKLPQILIENCPLTVAISLAILLAGPKDCTLDIPSVVKSQTKTLMEMPNFTVPEVLAIFPEGPKDGGLIIPEVVYEKANMSTQEFISLIATIVTPFNQHMDLEISKMNEKFPQISRENNFLTVATSLAILLQGPKDLSFEVEKVTSDIPTVDFEEFKAPVSAVVIPETPKETDLDVPKIFEKLPKVSIEDFLPIAEITSVLPAEPKDEYFEVTKTTHQEAKVTIEELKAAETKIIPYEEPLPEPLSLPEIVKKQPLISVQQPVLITAQAIFVIPEECTDERSDITKLKSQQAKLSLVETSAAAVAETTTVMTAKEEIFKVPIKDTKVKIVTEESKTVEAKIEEVEIQAKIKIPPVTDNSISEVFAEYSVELPKEEENVYAEFGFKEQKKAIDSEIYKSIKLMKKREFQKQSMEASYSLVKELQTQISMAEIEGLQAEFIRSGSISSSSSKSTSPLTPLIEEYLFRLKGPYLWRRYLTLEDVFEEASLKLKSKIQKSTVQNFETSLTLILQDVAMAQYESDNDIEVIEIEDYEDIRSLHFWNVLSAGSYKQSGSFTSSQSSVMQSALATQSLESSLTENMQSSTLNAAVSHNSASSSRSAMSLKAISESHVETASAIAQSISVSQSKSSQLAIEQKKTKAAKSIEATAEATSKSVEASISRHSLSKTDKMTKASIAEASNIKSMETDIAKKADILKTRTPSPPIAPPTPLTDEYMFRLQTQMPEPSHYIPRDCSISPEGVEEEIILKCGLIPHIRTTIERILYSPPLITPPTSPDATVPIYSKPGVKSGVFKFLS